MKHGCLALLLAFACARGGDDDGGGDDARRIDSRLSVDGPSGGADAPPTVDGPAGGADAPTGMLVEIQDVRDRTIALDTVVSIEQVYLIGRGMTSTGNVTLYIQEPQGDSAGSHIYPEYAGMSIFIDDTKLSMFTLPDVGDCIDVTGTVDVAFSQTQLKGTTITAASACGAPPVPHAVGGAPMFAEIATDTDAGMAGDQAGTMAEVYEGVLVQVAAVEAVANADIYGEVPLALTGTTTPTLDMDDFLYAHGATMGTSYATVVGIYTQFTNYKIMPRSAADLTP